MYDIVIIVIIQTRQADLLPIGFISVINQGIYLTCRPMLQRQDGGILRQGHSASGVRTPIITAFPTISKSLIWGTDFISTALHHRLGLTVTDCR